MPDFLDAGGFIQCPVSAFAEFRQATPAVREEPLGGQVTLLQISLFARGRSDGRMPKPPSVFRYRVRNWRAYNHALINRGRLIVRFDEHTVTA